MQNSEDLACRSGECWINQTFLDVELEIGTSFVDVGVTDKDLPDCIGITDCDWFPFAKPAGIVIQLGERQDISGNLLDIVFPVLNIYF